MSQQGKIMNRVASKLGIDLSKLGDQAENTWAMLNDLHDSDPDAYRKFINDQLEGLDKDSYRHHGGDKFFTPQKGFVVKSTITHAKEPSSKIFVNFCHHKAIQMPFDASGVPIVNEHVSNLVNLQIPLVVSKVRPISNDSSVLAVDVVLNPWCFTTCETNHMFKCQIVELGLLWVRQEHKIQVSLKWKFIQSLYKGGIGKNNSDVHPFLVQQTSNGVSEEAKKVGSIDPEIARDDRLSEGKARQDVMRDPLSLLQSMRSMNSDMTSGSDTEPLCSIIKPTRSSSSVLVKEISSTTNAIIPESPTLNKDHRKVPLKKQMKGFLNKSKGCDGLYKEGSSGDGAGGTGGAYSKFMSKCQVVDTSQLSTEKKREFPPNPSSDSNDLGFLENDQRVGASTKGSSKCTFDAEFQDMMERADPDFASAFHRSPTRENADESEELMKSLSKLSHTVLDVERRTLSEHGKQELVERETSLRPERRKSEVLPDVGSSKEDGSRRLNYVVDRSGTKVIIHVDLSDERITVSDVSCLDLQVEDSTLHLTTKCGRSLSYPVSCAIDINRIAAKLSKTRKMLEICIPLC